MIWFINLALDDVLTLGKKKSSAVLVNHVEVTLKDIDEENSFQLTDIQVVLLIVHFSARIYDITYSWVVANGLVG